MSQPAVYPNALPLWLDKRDSRDVVEAAHVNRIQSELDATQRALGTGIVVSDDRGAAWYPQGGSGPATGNRFWAFTGGSSPLKWASVHDRLNNIEKAALRNLDFNYISLFGGAVINPTVNTNRIPDTGGLAVQMDPTDPQPAFAVLNVGQLWPNGAVTLWANGDIRGSILRLKSRSTVNTAVLDPDTGFTIGQVSIGPNKVFVGPNIRLQTDQNVPGHVILRMAPPTNPGADLILVDSGSGGVRNAIRIRDAAGNIKFSVNSNGDTVVNTLKVMNPPTDNNNLFLNGVHLHKGGLFFNNTQFGPGLGGSYRPDGLSFGAGGGMSPAQVSFSNGQRIRASGPNIVLSGPLTHVEGGLLAMGMETKFYSVAGSMFIPIPQKPGGPQGPYEAPRRTKNNTDLRHVAMAFAGPPTGRVKISWSVEIRAYSRPVYVSFGIYDVSQGSATVLNPADTHACMNNGARSAKEQTDVDHVTTASVAVVSGLRHGHVYHLVVFTRAADTGAGDVGKAWTQADNARFLIEPMMTAYSEGVVSG